MVIRKVLLHGFLHGGDSLEVVEVSLGVLHGIVGHEVGCLFHLLGIAVEDVGRGLVTIDFLCHIDVMGLLPDEEGSYVGGGFTCPRVGHLHPSDAFEALTLGNVLCFGIGDVIVPLQEVGQVLGTVPEGEMDGVPPCHL